MKLEKGTFLSATPDLVGRLVGDGIKRAAIVVDVAGRGLGDLREDLEKRALSGAIAISTIAAKNRGAFSAIATMIRAILCMAAPLLDWRDSAGNRAAGLRRAVASPAHEAARFSTPKLHCK